MNEWTNSDRSDLQFAAVGVYFDLAREDDAIVQRLLELLNDSKWGLDLPVGDGDGKTVPRTLAIAALSKCRRLQDEVITQLEKESEHADDRVQTEAVSARNTVKRWFDPNSGGFF